jgi:hypothetical protein
MRRKTDPVKKYPPFIIFGPRLATQYRILSLHHLMERAFLSLIHWLRGEKVCFRGPNDIGHLALLIKLSFRITTLINLSRRMLLLISNLVIMYLCIYVNVGR